MLKVPVLLLVFGSASLGLLAEGASTRHPQDGIVTTVTEGDLAALGIEDSTGTLGMEGTNKETPGLTTLVPTSIGGVTRNRIEDHQTAFGSTVPDQGDPQSTTAPKVVTSHSREKVSEETQIIVKKDGLATITLVGIIVGILIAICLLGGIILVVVRRMSGGYSP
ncbi:podoplanin [Tenrec ecaudatus]|uniref:podoplanin n=1 Tax=Tenrec ecaudatus TaxID=94439 RepID=UPI003F599180